MSALDDFLRPTSKSAKFPTVGTVVRGEITSIGEPQQATEFGTNKPKCWPDGTPIRQMAIGIRTGDRDPDDPMDDGVRSLWIEDGKNIKKALIAAITASKARLQVGGTLTCTYIGDGERKNAGVNPPKLYQVLYEPPTPGAQAQAEFLGQATTTQTAPPQQSTPAAAAGAGEPVKPPNFPASHWAALPMDTRRAVAAVQ